MKAEEEEIKSKTIPFLKDYVSVGKVGTKIYELVDKGKFKDTSELENMLNSLKYFPPQKKEEILNWQDKDVVSFLLPFTMLFFIDELNLNLIYIVFGWLCTFTCRRQAWNVQVCRYSYQRGSRCKCKNACKCALSFYFHFWYSFLYY